ncbi:MAG: AraC family transcriptional regulator [Ardenticatenaceae bacterium]|nr:AraC family transcriptional regulator [Ardenticatenaceae bacterium]
MKQKLLLPTNHSGALWFYDRRPYPIRAHHHEELECNLVVRGHGAYLIDGRKTEIAPHSILWLFPGQNHILLEQSPDFAMWILLIKPDFLAQICVDEGCKLLLEENPPGNFCRYLTEKQAKKLWQQCEEITAVQDQLSYFNIGLGYLLHTAWFLYQQARLVAIGANVHPAVDQAARLINGGLEGDDLISLAQTVGLSPHRLSRLFKQQIEMSLTDFRNKCRLERFLELYENGRNKTMLDTAMEAGFGSYAQFYRVFKQIMDVTPADFDRQLKSTDSSS